AGGERFLCARVRIHFGEGVIVWLGRPTPMPIANLEPLVCKCAGDVECGLACLDLALCLGARADAGSEGKNPKQNRRMTFHFTGALFSISSITFPTASLTFRTSSTLGALPSGKETSFSIPAS